MTYTTHAIVLKKISMGEADAAVVLYTRDFGKVRAYAQGVKKETAKLKGHIEPLCLVSVQFVIGSAGERLTYAQMLEPWQSIRNDFDRYTTAIYIAELIDRHCLFGEKNQTLWQFIITHFAALARTQDDSRMIIKDFEKDFLSSMGYDSAEDMRMLGERLARPSRLIYTNKSEA